MRYLFAFALLLGACAPDPLPGYRAATDDERTTLLATVVDYYDILNVALVSGDLAPLYARHPKLAQGQVRERGINIEGLTASYPSFAEHRVRDVTVDVAAYEPFRAFVKDDRAVAYSHGAFTWHYFDGADTGGELLKRFDLTRSGSMWTIDQTDEWVLGEGTPPPTPR